MATSTIFSFYNCVLDFETLFIMLLFFNNITITIALIL